MSLEGEQSVELCDRCGQIIPPGAGLRARVADSSFLDPADSGMDGKRPVNACCQEHLDDLRVEYWQRPFIAAELWASKVMRARFQHGSDGGRMVSGEELAESTGLSMEEIERAVVCRPVGCRQAPMATMAASSTRFPPAW